VTAAGGGVPQQKSIALDATATHSALLCAQNPPRTPTPLLVWGIHASLSDKRRL
jgi:hypothetical protein